MKSYKQVFDMKGDARDPEYGYESSYHLLQEIPWHVVKRSYDETHIILNLYFEQWSNREEMKLVTRVHVGDMNIGNCSLSISRTIEGPYLDIASNMTVPHGKELIIKAGSIPSQFIKLSFSRKMNGRLPQIHIYGLDYENIGDRIGLGAEQYLFDIPYKLTYEY